MTTELGTAFLAPVTARRMRAAALRFVESLSDAQVRAATFPLAGDERYQWHYTPVQRNGLRLKDMNQAQRDLALELMGSGLSLRGLNQAREIIAHETILNEWERVQNEMTQWLRDPELYFFSVFGDPAGKDPWGWRAGGHHIGIHFTIVEQELVSPLPLFLGANPAEVRHGPEKGKRILAEEEDLARSLLGSLDTAQKKVAIVDPVAPADILTKNYRSVDRSMPLHGLPYRDMLTKQRDRLITLIRHYVARTAEDVERNEWQRIEHSGLDAVTFAWAGPEERGRGHYYSVVGPLFMIEYDNTQNDGNHIHSVWRDFTNDWGEDLLARHYGDSDHH